ncbi:MAG: extracellular solute-binding protein [Clostridia bacterium]|nr:extracellular solute-binding protein [Clostridia bacterium]
MRNKNFTRFLCLLLAVMCLVSSAVVAVGAAGESTQSNLTDKSIEDYRETMGTISYEEYEAFYFGNAKTPSKELKFSMTDDWTFENGNIRIVGSGDSSWKMTVYASTVYANADDAKKAGYTDAQIVSVGDGTDKVRVIVESYDSLDAALAAKDSDGVAKYDKADLAYVTTDYDGVKALYTPSIGSVTWMLDLGSEGIDFAALFNIGLRYYPVVAKSSAIEREFYINGSVPFSEALSLQLPKIWSSYDQGSVVGEKESTLKELRATYTLTNNDDLNAIIAEAETAGFVAGSTYTVSEDQKSVTFVRPEVIYTTTDDFIEKYGLRFFSVDINKNEMRPTQLQDPEWTEYMLRDSEGFTYKYEAINEETNEVVATYDSEYFGFVLTPDENGMVSITLDGVNQPMALSEITLKPYTSAISYDAYYNAISKEVGTDQGKSIIKLEAENTSHTSTNVVYPIEDRVSAFTSPADTTRTVLNTIGTEKWSTAGQWVEYTFSVDSSGWYDVYSRFKQSYLEGMYVSRTLQIFTNYANEDAFKSAHNSTAGYYNGYPFAEATQLRYDYGTDWQVTKLTSDGNDVNASFYQIYFRAGVEYTIRLEVTLGSMSEYIREIESVLNSLNQAYLDIIKLTGADPDTYSDYSFSRILPDTLNDMVNGKQRLTALSTYLRDTAGVASTYTGVCDKLAALIGNMVQNGGEPIAKNLETYKSYVGSLGTFLTDAKTQPLQLDYIMIQPATAEAPKATPNFFQAFWHELNSFIQSFFRDYNSMGANVDNSNVSGAVEVWVPYGRDQANVIRNLATNGFTQDSGIPVNLKLVSGGTLLPSILAQMGPDVYLGLDENTVINYAIRGALMPIEDMEDFDTALDSFNYSAVQVLGIADADNEMHYYGLPETQSFSMMFVRLDVLADVGIEIPKTWDELYIAQSELQSKNMEIGVSTDFQMFLYQMGGSFWADGGMRINLDSEEGLASFEKMCNMFTQYSFPYQYDGANRFRTGEMPIIIANYTGLYNQLKVFATELEGSWAFVPVPGWKVKNEDGTTTIQNYSMSQVNAVVMISGTENTGDAWKFMKWYTGAEAQADYANEMVAIIGDSAKHNTANRYALAEMPWTYDEYTELSKQFDNVLAVENYPGNYFIGRYTNFAFLSAYNDGADPTTELLNYINTINTEITRKREEFGLETLELGQTLAEKRAGQATEALKLLTSSYNYSRYEEAYDSAMYGIVNMDRKNVSLESKTNSLYAAADILEEILLEEKWDGKETEYETVSGDVKMVPSYYKNISKQTMERDDGGYEISSLNEQQLLYFIAEVLRDVADALISYEPII